MPMRAGSTKGNVSRKKIARAVITYIAEPAKLNGLDPEAYIAAVLDRLAIDAGRNTHHSAGQLHLDCGRSAWRCGHHIGCWRRGYDLWCACMTRNRLYPSTMAMAEAVAT